MNNSLRKGQKVFVTVKGGSAGHMVEQPGVITEASGRGAFVKLERGRNSNFFRMNQIRVDPGPIKAAPGKLTTLGEVAKIKTVPKLEANPAKPINFTQPVDALKIGEFIKTIRKELGLEQETFARGAGISAVELSEIERDITRPSDEVLLKISECFQVDIGFLEARNKEQSAPPKQVVPSEPPRQTNDVEDSFLDFIEALEMVVPMPTDKVLRRQWIKLARVLFVMRGTTS